MPKKNLHDHPVYQFADENADSKKQCLFVRLVCQRFLKDLKRNDILFDPEKADRIFRYFRMFRHKKGAFAGNVFELRPEQKFFAGQLFGWMRKDGKRRFTEAYKEEPRKGGKSHFAGGLGGYALTSDGEASPEVYSLATTEQQAGFSYNAFLALSKTTARYREGLQYRTGVIRHPASGGIFMPLASDADSHEGSNPSFVIYDEYHLWKTDAQRDSMSEGMGGRDNPIEFTITTAGTNRHSPCFNFRRHAIDVLRGKVTDDFLLPMIHTLDDGDDPYDVASWYKANPALGISKSLEYMQRRAERASISAANESSFFCKQLDIWTSVYSGWLKEELWDACLTDKTTDILKGKYCFGGLDLSNRGDLTALVLVFPPQDGLDKFYALPFFWVPADNADKRERVDRVPYRTWERDGFVKIFPEGHIRMSSIEAEIRRIKGIYEVRRIFYDKWNITELRDNLSADGFLLESFSQEYKSFSPAVKSLEAAIVNKDIAHFGNPCLAWNIGNVVVTKDSSENMKFDKGKAADRIDGAVALAMGIGGFARTPVESGKNWLKELAARNKKSRES